LDVLAVLLRTAEADLRAALVAAAGALPAGPTADLVALFPDDLLDALDADS
jgi:hypothetical protein